MKKAKLLQRLVLLVLCLAAIIALTACSGSKPTVAAQATAPATLGTIQLNAHPASLEGKTVVLRWNGKPNGDKLLNAIADQLTQKVKDVKIIKLWETDPDTAKSSEKAEVSEQFAVKIAALKPDLVIASQCD